MPGKPCLVVRKPISVLNQPLKVNFKKLFVSLGKVSVDAATLNYPGIVKECLGWLESVGLSKNPGQIAWLLILRSLSKAMAALVVANLRLLKTEPNDLEEIAALVQDKLESAHVQIDRTFFDRPTNLSLVPDLKNIFALWLQNRGVDFTEASSIAAGLSAHFTEALDKEWAAHRAEYAPISEFFATPFTQAAERELAWVEYASWLQRRVQEPMFDERFSVSDVYVRLRGYYKDPEANTSQGHDTSAVLGSTLPDDKVPRKVVDATENLRSWFENGSGHKVRVLSGGPGAGKSTFAKMFAAELSAKGERVLFVPLHALDLKRPLNEAVGEWAGSQPSMPEDPLDFRRGDPRLLVIFDGLDELAMAGKIAQDLAKEFVGDLEHLVKGFEQSDAPMKVLLTGREIVVQSITRNYSQAEQILHLLPYYVDAHSQKPYKDPGKLLEADQRDLYWEKYGKVCGKNFDRLPDGLRSADLIPITAEPLLNYLVALVYEPGNTGAALSGNRNDIYRHLLEKVHERVWEKQPHPGTKGLRLDEFKWILEEIALSAWHGQGRSTTADAVVKRCEACGLTGVLTEYEGKAERGLLRLLTAFYIRKSEHGHPTEAAFEFTHKSFGEYLTACGIVRGLEAMHDEFLRRSMPPYRGWDERTALHEWALLCGPTAMDLDLLTFILDEVRLRDTESVKAWKTTLAHLIEYMLPNGMPMELVEHCRTYQEQCIHARNAEEGLLAALSACVEARNSLHAMARQPRPESLPDIKWPSDTSFGTWLHRLQGQSGQHEGPAPVAVKCLGSLNLRGTVLTLQDLGWANLSGADLSAANLWSANLEGAYLSGANLKEASLIWTYLQGACLSEANLSGANLLCANLEGAGLSGANLVRAHLEGANLKGTDLSGANLVRAHLEGANLKGADLQHAILGGAILAGTDLSLASLEGAYLRGANLADADLREAKLQGANLEGANLKGANLCDADLREAKLQGANFEGANLEGAFIDKGNPILSTLSGDRLEGLRLVEPHSEEPSI